MHRHNSSSPCWLSAAVVAMVLTTAGCHWKNPAERAATPILEKNAVARGGRDAWRAVKSMSWSGKLDAGKRRDEAKLAMAYLRPRSELRAEARRALAHADRPPPEPTIELPFVLEMERPRKTRLEIRFQGQTAVQAYDGEHGWKLRPFLGRHEVETYTAEELRLASQQTDLDGPLMDYAAKGNRVELVGTEPVEGRDAYRLKVTSPDGQSRNVWVDTETLLDVKLDGTRRLDGKARPVWTYFRDYKSVDGLMIPHLLETAVEGIPGSEKIRIDHVVVNPKLDRERFAKPD